MQQAGAAGSNPVTFTGRLAPILGVVDLEPDGPMFAPLRQPGSFRSFRVDPELGTIVWPGGADISPDCG